MAYNYIINTGVVVADTSDILAEVQLEYLSTFGSDLSLAPSTPQGVLITAETEARSSTQQNNAQLANQINPNLAGGRFLDAIGRLTGIQRTPNEYSTMPCLLTGIAGTVIPAGVIAQTSSGQQAQSITIVTLNSSGTATVDFQALLPGPLAFPTASLTNIVSDILGWETVTNTDNATLGATTESDQAFRYFRNNTLGFQGLATAIAVTSRLNATPGVLSSEYLENFTSSTVVKRGVTLIPHSIWVCVDGGLDIDVATQIFYAKTGGTGYNGAVTVLIPGPTTPDIFYPVSFDRPTQIPVLVRATIRSTSVLADPVAIVKQAVLDYANGQTPVGEGFVVGASVSPFEIAAAINSEAPGIYVQKLEVSFASPIAYQTTELVFQIFQQATIVSSSISVIQL